jgi:hypothetical protein
LCNIIFIIISGSDTTTAAAARVWYSQATEVLRGSGALSAERKQYLEELRTQLNLSKETGDKILR